MTRDITSNIRNADYSMGAVIVAGMVFNVITAVASSSSPQSSLTMLNSVQLILLLPLIGTYLSANTLDFIRGMKFCLFSFDLMPESLFSSTKSYVNFEQNNTYLYLIGLESGSTLLNIISVIGVSII